MSDRALFVGFDLGTTNSAAAVFDGQRSEAVRADDGGSLTPSVVRIDGKGRVTVGARAKRQQARTQGEVIGEFKRLMGTGDKLRFEAAGVDKSPEELAALVLESLRRDVADQTGVSPERAVVSVPALFELPQSAATARAAELAGLSRVELIAEPVASAIASGWSNDEPSGAWLVYDLGGGTFDVSLLETRDGLLRVVGHDGDNFLGGRDFDWALVDYVLEQLEQRHGKAPKRGNPAHEGAIARLKQGVEDVKIQLSRRQQAELVLDDPIEVDGEALEVALSLDRTVLEGRAAPIVERTIDVCKRLLSDRGVTPGDLSQLVFVGGPTMASYVRDRVTAALGARAAEGHDPMTLVARGAAIYAASANLDARPVTAGPLALREGRKVWLQYPALSSDLTPHVVGRVLAEGGGPTVATVQLQRTDGQWTSPEAKVGDDGGFVLTTELVPRQRNVFTLHAKTEEGASIQLDPPEVAIMQGLSITDPPLSRSVGVALADDSVHVYFERGVPLPARRTFTHRTVESVARGSDASVLKIPVVQGEMELAHLCRHVGTLEIPGAEITDSLPAGAAVEVTLELDRGGRLSAQALVPSLDQSFDGVAQLMIPDTDPEALTEALVTVRQRIKDIRSAAFRDGSTAALQRFKGSDVLLAEIERDIAACRGGDTDAGQRARRNFLEAEAMVHDVELSRSWPELDARATQTLASAQQWVSDLGSDIERRLLEQASTAAQNAREARDAPELQRQLRVVRRLRNAAYFRHPQAWAWQFEGAASEAHRASDIVAANALVAQGQAALDKGDTQGLRAATEGLYRLLPPDARAKRKSFDSGVR